MKKQELYIHIGAPKTGTSSIQSFCHDNFKALKDQGILYPVEDEFCQGVAQHKLAASLKKNLAPWREKSEDSNKLYTKLRDYYSKSECRKIIVSTECFFGFSKGELDDLKRLLDDFSVKVIIYLRRQDDWLLSAYNHSNKVLLACETRSQEVFFNERLKVGGWLQKIQTWDLVFGKENIKVRFLGKGFLHENDLYKDFIQCLEGDWSDGLVVPKPVNTALPWQVVEVLSYFNRLLADEFKDASVDRLHKELKPMKIELIALLKDVFTEDGSDIITPADRKDILFKHKDENDKIFAQYMSNYKTNPFEYVEKTYKPYKQVEKEDMGRLLVHIWSKYNNIALDDLNDKCDEEHMVKKGSLAILKTMMKRLRILR